MKIIHAVPYFPPVSRYGGTPEAVFSLAKAQMRQGHTVNVITTDAGLSADIPAADFSLQWFPSPYCKVVGSYEAIKVWYFKNRLPGLACPHKIFTAFMRNPEAEALLSGADIVHFHEVHIPGYASLARTAKLGGSKIFISPHGSLLPPTLRGWKKGLHRLLDPLMRWGWFRSAEGYIALCREEAQQFLTLGIPESRIHIIPHGQPEFVSFPCESSFYPLSECPAFLYLGRLNTEKGIFTALQAFQRCWEKGLRSRLICSGPDEGAVSLIKSMLQSDGIPCHIGSVAAEPGVYLCPPCAHDAIPCYFNSADCTICPSPYESFGLVPVESLQNHTPVIISQGYGCLEHLSLSPEWIQVVPKGDARCLQEKMEAFFPRPNKKQLPPGSQLLPTWDAISQAIAAVYLIR